MTDFCVKGKNMDIRKIEPGEIDAVLEVFANNFFDDRYYQGWYKDKKEMMDDFREVMTWTLENGWNMGAYEGGYLVGMALTFLLRKLDDYMFGEFFGNEGNLHDRMKEHIGCIYVFAVCVNEEHRHKGVATELFSSILDPCEEYVADTTNKIAKRMLEKRHFVFNRIEWDKDWWESAHRTKLYERDSTKLPDGDWYGDKIVESTPPFPDGTAWKPEQSGKRLIYGKPLVVGDTLSMLYTNEKTTWLGFYPVKAWGRTFYGAEHCVVVGVDDHGIALLYSIEDIGTFRNRIRRYTWDDVCNNLASGHFVKTGCSDEQYIKYMPYHFSKGLVV